LLLLVESILMTHGLLLDREPWIDSIAYAPATNISPPRMFGVAYAIILVATILSYLLKNRERKIDALIVATVIVSTVTTALGSAILIQTMNGTVNALPAAFRWYSSSVVAVGVLSETMTSCQP